MLKRDSDLHLIYTAGGPIDLIPPQLLFTEQTKLFLSLRWKQRMKIKTALLRVGSECYRNKDTAVSCCVAFHFSIETFTFGNKPMESPVALRTGGETDTFYCQHTHMQTSLNIPISPPLPPL